MSAMEWVETSGERGETPEQLAALERAAFSAYPALLEVVDRQAREFASEAAGIGASHDRDALAAKLAAHRRQTVASRVPGIVRFLLGAAVLLGPVIAFALILVRRAFPLADSIEVGGMLQLIAGGAALVSLVALLIDRRPLALGQQVLDGAAIVAVLTVVLAAWQTTASPEIAGSNAGSWIVADVVGALAIIALNVGERTMRSRSRSAFERGIVEVRERLAAHDLELSAAYAMRFDAITRAVDALPLEQRRGMLDDRDAAIERLVASARLRRSSADHVMNLRLGELCLQGAARSPRAATPS
ncbi:hypothetical protein J7E25_06015 [Agromyces sp. ISL-38]|uniref:hypothetical protein n=1 Tax=Agromyces sp. ISL-38 TaxID=2819107 RepID=UPI001BE74846|nr:hypothetical protein [Agromyces sp. ISL-38]MBT2498645.1 hypothetical protein [Agromyces sp. ISL-38]MBT2518512.1 hypothetical protein [Streptomyces sp. ISL-90]